MKNKVAYLLVLSCLAWSGTHSVRTAYSAEVIPNQDQGEPATELARWHSGQVYFDGQWRHIEHVQQLVSTDPRWRQYRKRAADLDGSPEAHAELARWCHRHRLEHGEKLHWLHVLKHLPRHRSAIKGLGLVRYRGQLYTLDHVKQLKVREKATVLALYRYKPEFTKLRRAAHSRKVTEREAALAQLAAIYDPAAIPALIEVAELDYGKPNYLPKDFDVEDESQFKLEFQKSAVAALTNISDHAATEKLLEIAVLSPYGEIRTQAAEGLIPRDKTSYMPLLMASLAAPLKANIELDVSPSGMVILSEYIVDPGPETQRISSRDSNYLSTTYFLKRKITTVHHEMDRARAQTRALQTQANVASTNFSRFYWNARVGAVLQIATGEIEKSTPEQWWDYWKEYNELAYPEETPTYTTSTYDNFIYSSTAPSCFVAGTPVWTLSGPTPIESVRVDDLVLSQDPVTGCLDYQPVLKTTFRPPSPTVELSLEDETIITTRGHRFWVFGDGWRMAKHLCSGDRLHGVSHAPQLESAAEGHEAEAFNLVVGEFHTYFVGSSRLLVHDNGCPSPTQAIAPGIETVSNDVR